MNEFSSRPEGFKTTPVMAQYLAIKQGQPDCLVLYRMGDFYELFFEDAAIASATLGIALTKRGKHNGEDIAMCGVPVHALDHYLQKLIRSGHRVAVCEQMENPAEAKKRGSKSVVARAVTRLVTPGTLTEDSLLDASASNYLACFATVGEGREAALAFADISTGEFAVMATDESRLGADLARLSPSELLISDKDLSNGTFAAVLSGQGFALSPQPHSRFDVVAAEHRLKLHFKVESLDAFGSFARADVAALGTLLQYLTLTQIGQIPHLRQPRLEQPDGCLLIDAATRANLELMRSTSGEKPGSLLHALCETVTPQGSRLIAANLARPLASALLINERLDVVEHFHELAALGDAVRNILRAVPDVERALARITANRASPRDLAALRDALIKTRELSALLVAQRDFTQRPARLNKLLSTLLDAPFHLAEDLRDALDDELPAFTRDGGFIKPGYSADLDHNLKLRDDTRQVIAQLQANYASSTGIKSLKVRHNNIIGYFVEVQAQFADALKASSQGHDFHHRQTVINAMRYSTPALAELEQKIALAASRALALELDYFAKFCEAVTTVKATLSDMARVIAEIDVHCGLAHLARRHYLVRPKVDETLAFAIEGGRHLVVERALAFQGKSAFIGNDCELGLEQKKLWLLTGPNMAGKSTFLRQNALIAVMAQMGSFVPARSAHIGVIDRLYSRVGAADDLARGRSTFMVEMIETATILNQATPKSLVILDEIGRGTATYDGLSIAWATLEYLHDVTGARGLFATHYHELTALALPLKKLHCATMAVKEWKGDIVFLHRVIEGVAERSYGIQAAKLAGLPAAVIMRATEVLKRLEQGKLAVKPASLLEDLPLFAVVQKEPSSVKDPLQERLDAIQVDALSPREALNLLYELKSLGRAAP